MEIERMLTVSKLARECGLSRGTLLYYESVGVLKAASRTAGNYRRYAEKDLLRLRQICAYRDMGLGLRDIRSILERPENEDYDERQMGFDYAGGGPDRGGYAALARRVRARRAG